MFFTWKLQDTRDCINDTLRHRNVLYDDDDPVPSLSQALAAYRSIPGTTQKSATMAASKWQGLVDVLVDRWAELARKATELHKTCREVATKADDEAATATARARKLQDKAARYGTAQGNVVELGQALGGEEGAGVVAGHEAQVRRDARVAASEARRASTVRQRMEAALGLLERLVAACDEATAFPRELQRPLGDIKAILKGTNEASPDVPKDLVAKVAMAEQLWEANARLVKDHLGGTVRDIINCYFGFWPTSPSACEVAERCQRAIEDIPRLLRPPECPQSVPRVSPVSMEPQEVQQEGEEGRRDTGEDKGADGGCQQEQEADQGTEGQRGPLRGTGPLQEATSVTRSLTPPQLQALVAVVATLGEVVATVTGPHWAKSPNSLHEDLKNFTQSLRAILNHSAVTSRGHHGFPSLGRALATLRTTPGTTCADVRASVASTWRKFVAKIVDRWDWLAREATKLCEKVVMEQQLMVALDKEEVARELAMHDAEVAAATNEAMAEAVVATRWAMVATRRGHWAEVALGLLQHLVATCDRATLFNWNMEWWLRDIETTLKGTKEVSPDDPEALVFKVVKFQWLWDVSTRLAKDHLLGTLGDIDKILLSPCGDHGGPDGPGSRTVAKRCQRAVEDIPRLLQERFTWEQ
ncbi:uncharacterized protein LOC108964630 isoform X1 [Serinus canaria]|uniref:uncharacterized protein LOC108964630 isoform X1 n=1 Tax=Serinus canaria TaxID=9135 RepID=UPI0021CCC726|nr:uncharacterized protein LOC108964630 isoform X1 [Serinus canaria]